MKKFFKEVLSIVLFVCGIALGFSGGKIYSLATLSNESNVIIEGKVISVNCYENESGMVFSDVHFSVNEVIKGVDLINKEIIITVFGGTLNNITTTTDVHPQFKKGEDVILFLKRTAKKDNAKYTVTGLSQGRFNILTDKNKNKVVSRDKLVPDKIKVTNTQEEVELNYSSIRILSEFKKTIKKNMNN